MQSNPQHLRLTVGSAIRSSSSRWWEHAIGIDVMLPQLARDETTPELLPHREHDDHPLRGGPSPGPGRIGIVVAIEPAQANAQFGAGGGPAPQALVSEQRRRVDCLVRSVDLLQEAVVDGFPLRRWRAQSG